MFALYPPEGDSRPFAVWTRKTRKELPSQLLIEVAIEAAEEKEEERGPLLE